MVERDYPKLRGRIKEVCGTQAAFAVAMGLTPTSVSEKLNRKSEWTQREIINACRVLKIEYPSLHEYFFAP